MKRGNAAVAPPPEKSTTVGAGAASSSGAQACITRSAPTRCSSSVVARASRSTERVGPDGLEPPGRQHEAVERVRRAPRRAARGELARRSRDLPGRAGARGAAGRQRLEPARIAARGEHPVAAREQRVDDRGPEAAGATHHDDAPRFTDGPDPTQVADARIADPVGRAGDLSVRHTPGIACPSVSFAAQYLGEVAEISAGLDAARIDAIAEALAEVRERGGRLFILGAGGGAGHASHAVNDFRKICDLESYAPSDNVSELTARVNDEGWDDRLLQLAAWLAADAPRRDPRVLGGGRVPRARHLHEPGQRDRAGARGRGSGGGRRRQGGRRHRDARRPLRHRARRSRRAPHAAHRGLSGGGLAPAGLAPGARDARGHLGGHRADAEETPAS